MEPQLDQRGPQRSGPRALSIFVGVFALILVAGGMLILQQWGSNAAAGSPDNGDGNGELIVKPIPIEHIDVLLQESFPVRAVVAVRGTLGDGCTEAREPEITREGNTFTVTILSERPKDAYCTMILKFYEENIPLGEVAPGDYTVHVNDQSATFHVD